MANSDKWAKIISKFLKPNGQFVFVEFHPVVWMFDDDFEKIGYRYFNSGAIFETESGTYADKKADITQSYVMWNHGISEVLNSLIKYDLMKWQEASAGGSMSTTLEDFTTFYTTLISGTGLSKKSFNNMTITQVRIKSRRQFGPLAVVDSTENDNIRLGYGLGVGVFYTPFGRAFFKEGHDDGWGHYSICFLDKKIAILIMTNNDNGESIFKELLAYSIGDVFTPWRWENYIPYNQK